MMKKLFKNRSFLLLFQGSLVSAVGTSLYSFAAGFYVQDMFGENRGAIYLSSFIALGILVRVVVSPFAGAIVDKWNKIRIIYMTDFIRGLLFFATLYMLQLNLDKTIVIMFLLLVTALSALNQAFFGPSVTAVLPEIVGEDMLQAANGANSIIGSVQTILGVLAGMFLYELLGFEIAVLINAISFMVSGFSEMFIKSKYQTQEDKEHTRFTEDIKFGFRYLVQTDGLLTMMMFSLMLNFAFTPFISVGFPYLFRTELGKSAFHLGMTDISFAIAMMVAGVVIGGIKFKNMQKTVQLGLVGMTLTFIYIVAIVSGITYSYINYWTFYTLFIVGSIVMAGVMILTNVPLNTAMVKAIEPSVRGRVFSTISAMSSGMIPVAVMIGGFIVNEYNVAMLGLACGLVLLIPTFGFLLSKKVNLFFLLLERKELEQTSMTLQTES